MPMIRISDIDYHALKGLAESEQRSAANMLSVILSDRFGRSPTKNTPSPKNNETPNPETPYMKQGRASAPIGTAPSSDVSDLLKTPTYEEAQALEHEWEKNPTTKIKSEPTADTSSDYGVVHVKHVDEVVPTDLEFACCSNENRPCKHWIWDASSGEGYKNLLSGRFREAE